MEGDSATVTMIRAKIMDDHRHESSQIKKSARLNAEAAKEER
jgi:hypothetical protein